MKKLFTLCLFIALFAIKASAQTFNDADFRSNLGKTMTLCDEVSSVRIFSDTLALMNMGGSYPNQKFTIAVKGTKVTLDWANLKGKQLCVTGTFALHKDRPEIVVAQTNQITFPEPKK